VADVFASVPRKDQWAKRDCYLRGLIMDGRRKSSQAMASRLPYGSEPIAMTTDLPPPSASLCVGLHTWRGLCGDVAAGVGSAHRPAAGAAGRSGAGM